MLWIALQWRHNDHDSVSNYQPRDCLLNRLYRRRSKKTSKLRVTGLCVGNSPGPVNSPHKGRATRKMFPFNDVIMVFHCLQRHQCRRSTQNDNCPVFGGSINHLWCHCSLLWRHNDPHCHSIVCYCGYINNNRIVYVDYLIEPSASGASTPQGMYPRLLLTDSINPLWRLSAY